MTYFSNILEMRISLAIILAGLLISVSGYAQTSDQSDEGFAAYDIEDLIEELESSDKDYLPFINQPSLRTGLYTLPAGAVDKQQPHDMDEVYYILNGKASFTAGDKVTQIEKGSVLFVEANLEHRFHDIEENLQILVFFSTAK